MPSCALPRQLGYEVDPARNHADERVGAGHMNWLDQPDAIIDALDEFFRGNGPRSAGR
jgi:hypothetical protein